MTSPPPAPEHIGVLAASAGAVAVVDARWRFRFVSDPYLALTGRERQAILGRSVWEVFPEAVGTPRYDQTVAAARAGNQAQTVWRDVETGRWLEQRVLPFGGEVVLVLRDVTEYHEALERSRSLLTISLALAGALTPEQVATAAISRLLSILGASGGGVVVKGEPGQPAISLAWPGVPARVAGRWATLVAETSTPAGEVLESGEPVFATNLEQVKARWPHVAAELAEMGRRSLAVLPLAAGQRLLGVMVLHFDTEREFTPAEHEFLATVAAITGQALRRAQLVAREHAGSEAMQRALLPHSLPEVADVEVAARYRPGGQGVEVGGDWFDVIEMDGALAIVMGDVEGHDLAAAATMGQVRSAVRSYALLGHPPALVVAEANAFVASLGLERLITLFYAQVHPAAHLISAVCAGHPVPLLGQGRAVSPLDVPVGPPLGVPDGTWQERSVLLPAGARLLMFTDGLVERRGHDLEEGVRVVAAALAARPDATAEQMVDDALAAAGRPGPFADDVALLAVRPHPPAGPPSRRLRRRLPASPMGARVARRFVRDVLTAWRLDADRRDTAELLAGELLGNAARHSDQFIELRLEADEHTLRIGVYDRSHRLPVPREVGPEEPAGRGLLLVDTLSDAWGVEELADGKTVWFRLALG